MGLRYRFVLMIVTMLALAGCGSGAFSGFDIVVDPVTRIEGHMRCEVNVDDDNVIRNAVSTATSEVNSTAIKERFC